MPTPIAHPGHREQECRLADFLSFNGAETPLFSARVKLAAGDRRRAVQFFRNGANLFPTVSLAGVLALMWLLLSGHGTVFLLVLGLASVLLVTAIAVRLDIADDEGHPIHLVRAALGYWPWLLKEILVANVDVAKAILAGGTVQPRVFTVKASQASELGHATYANSITLTPGTVSIAVENGEITVHALTSAGADGVLNGEMDRRVTAMFERAEDEE